MTMTNWIPCSERLPDEDGNYLVTFENGYVRIAGYSRTQTIRYPEGFYVLTDDGTIAFQITHNLVIAWMELPQPYRGD